MKKTKKETESAYNAALKEYFLFREKKYSNLTDRLGSFHSLNGNRIWIPDPWTMEKCCYKILQDKYSNKNIDQIIYLSYDFLTHIKSIQHIAKKFKITQAELRMMVTNKKFLNKISK